MSKKRPSSESVTVADALVQLLDDLENPLIGLSTPEWADDIRNLVLGPRGLLDDLSPEQGQRLAKLITELSELENSDPSHRPRVQRRKEWTRRGRAYAHKIVAKTKAARKALTDLRNYTSARGVNVEPLDGVLRRALAVLDRKSVV